LAAAFEHYIRLALAGEAAKVNSFPGHLLKAFMNAPATLFTDFLALAYKLHGSL
jgi:hypothetical protein